MAGGALSGGIDGNKRLTVMTAIAYYTPFKPLGFPHPSGDLTIATGLRDHLLGAGFRMSYPSRLRARWIYGKPWLWPVILRDRRRSLRINPRPDIWLTYHTYYKSPDVLGPWASRKLGIPYVIFQGIYSTRPQRHWKTAAGFYLNRRALLQAQHVFTNRREDMINLQRIIADENLTYIAPGIVPEQFVFDAGARNDLRAVWNITESEPVILSAAMFRTGVKCDGLSWLIETCVVLHRQGEKFHLVIAGDGKERRRLLALAERLPSERVHFIGKIPRSEMHRVYSACDIFAFPGIRETLGMVYLEAQSCGLPVVAFENGGIPEVVESGVTGFLTPLFEHKPYADVLLRLMNDLPLCRRMGDAGQRRVRTAHDIHRNYRRIETVLHRLVS